MDKEQLQFNCSCAVAQKSLDIRWHTGPKLDCAQHFADCQKLDQHCWVCSNRVEDCWGDCNLQHSVCCADERLAGSPSVLRCREMCIIHWRASRTTSWCMRGIAISWNLQQVAEIALSDAGSMTATWRDISHDIRYCRISGTYPYRILRGAARWACFCRSLRKVSRRCVSVSTAMGLMESIEESLGVFAGCYDVCVRGRRRCGQRRCVDWQQGGRENAAC